MSHHRYLCPSCGEPTLGAHGHRVTCVFCGDMKAPRRNPGDSAFLRRLDAECLRVLGMTWADAGGTDADVAYAERNGLMAEEAVRALAVKRPDLVPVAGVSSAGVASAGGGYKFRADRSLLEERMTARWAHTWRCPECATHPIQAAADDSDTLAQRAQAHLDYAHPRRVRSNPAGHTSKAHPSHPSIADPHGWRRAIKAVEAARGKPERKFSSEGPKSDWGLVMHIYRAMPGAVVTSHHAKRYCLLRANQRATPNVCATTGAFFKTKADVEAAARDLPPGRYRAHLLYVDEGPNEIVDMAGESFAVDVGEDGVRGNPMETPDEDDVGLVVLGTPGFDDPGVLARFDWAATGAAVGVYEDMGGDEPDLLGRISLGGYGSSNYAEDAVAEPGWGPLVYYAAAKAYGKPIEPSDDLSGDAKRFWRNQPGRIVPVLSDAEFEAKFGVSFDRLVRNGRRMFRDAGGGED